MPIADFIRSTFVLERSPCRRQLFTRDAFDNHRKIVMGNRNKATVKEKCCDAIAIYFVEANPSAAGCSSATGTYDGQITAVWGRY